MTRTSVDGGVYFACPRCHGRAMGLALLRRLGSARAVLDLWSQAKTSEERLGKACPLCGRAMFQTSSSDGAVPFALDLCTRCQLVWFDPREYERFPPPENGRTAVISEKVREAVAMEALQRDAHRTASQIDLGDWRMIPGLLGLPVEENSSPVRSWPWVTYGLAGCLVLVYVLTFGHAGAVATRYGFVPAEAWRDGGLTFLTSFFLHAGFWHLLGNVYFLVVFGDNVEDDLGHWGFAVVMLVSALVGDACHWIGHSDSTIPAIGASGGISGIVMYYALRFPNAKIGILFRYWFFFQWLRISAIGALVFWFALQLFYIYLQQYGVGDVAALAHLGGAGVGLVVWLLWGFGARLPGE
ncbi:MAG: rhomboid family intramembrane serine protease [Planctomycetaceae bacterium]|nr:rhomboid family intramembrane serine protease [Planctomycetaceae bacterium]